MRSFFRKKLTVCLCFMLLFCGIFPYSGALATENNIVLGDANSDGAVNTADCVAVLKALSEITELDSLGECAADVNGDGKITTGDAAFILKYITDATFSFPAELGQTDDIPQYEDSQFAQMLYTPSEIGMSATVLFCDYTAYKIAASKDSSECFSVGYSFNLEKGDSVVFETMIFEEQVIDTSLLLFDCDMQLIKSDNDSGDGQYSRIEFTANDDSCYNLAVCSFDASQTGVCRFFAEKSGAASQTHTPDATATTSATPRVTATPSATPVETPVVSPEPTPTGVVGFSNVTIASNLSLPDSGEVVQFKQPYTLSGYVTSKSAITHIRLTVRSELTNEFEIISQVSFPKTDNIRAYSLSSGTGSIDAQTSFALLDIGHKSIELTCTTEAEGNILLYSAEFYVGATNYYLNGNAYNSGSTPLNASEKEKMLAHLNSLDESLISTKALMYAFVNLGIPYGVGSAQLDCSSFTQRAYSYAGISLPRTAAEQGRFCFELNGEFDRSEIIPGDLVFFRKNSCSCSRYREIHHVAFYVGTISGTRYYMESSYSLGRTIFRRAWGESGGSVWSIEFYGRPY